MWSYLAFLLNWMTPACEPYFETLKVFASCITNCFSLKYSFSKLPGKENGGEIEWIEWSKILPTNYFKSSGFLFKYSQINKQPWEGINKIESARLRKNKHTDFFFCSMRTEKWSYQNWEYVHVCSPWLQQDIDTLEKVQRRTVKSVSGLTGSYEEKL